MGLSRKDGWLIDAHVFAAGAQASYLGVHKATVYRTLERWKGEGIEGLGDRPRGLRASGEMTASTYAFLVNRMLGRPQGLIEELWA